jgi:sugar/nucleoside kinase (ribokinase family)
MHDVPKLFAELKQAGLTISLDTNDDPAGRWDGPIEDALRYVDILMPNEHEACSLAKTADFESAVRKLAELVPLLVVKRGSHGALVQHGPERHSVPAVIVGFVDAVGAGDSFNAGFLHGYVNGKSLTHCLHLGNLAGALSTTAVGGTTCFRDKGQMNEFFKVHMESLRSRVER